MVGLFLGLYDLQLALENEKEKEGEDRKATNSNAVVEGVEQKDGISTGSGAEATTPSTSTSPKKIEKQ